MQVHCSFDAMKDTAMLVANPKNPNKHSDQQIKLLAKIMKHQGWRHPITVSTRSGFIVAGHGRLMAAKLNGWEDCPVDFQDFENEADEYAHMVADNKIAELAQTDLAMVNIEVGDLGPEFDLDLLGIPDFKIDVADHYDEETEDNVPEAPKEAKTKPGDLYILGNHRLLCGDSTNIQHVDKLMAGSKADMVFTDPPYGVDYDGGHFHSGDVNIKRSREKLSSDDSTQIYKDVVPVLAQFCDGPCYTWFAGTKSIDLITTVNQVGQIHAMIIWHKTNATYAAMNSQYKQRHEPLLYWKPKGSNLRWVGATTENTLWEMKKDGKNNFHPTQKPVELAERAIKNHSADSVLDLFGGSGSTLIACEKTNRKCYMAELDPIYCDVIVNRWEQYTGKKAELTNGDI